MNVCWTPTALEDLERIVDYIAERNLVAAIELHFKNSIFVLYFTHKKLTDTPATLYEKMDSRIPAENITACFVEYNHGLGAGGG